MKNPADILPLLPSVDALLRTETARMINLRAGAKHATHLARRAADSLRGEILNSFKTSEEILTRENLLAKAERKIETLWRDEQKSALQKVINATGVIIHTNLGRAPLAAAAVRAVADEAAGYCTLEYDLESGKRGRRGRRAETLLAEITGAEDALVVNNCAAAAFLVLTALARGGEAIISRGELVEIGGDFRVPDVMEQSGATMREVGTTNRTKISDYEKAITENTRMILKVHPSNYRVVGFTGAPPLAELAKLAAANDLIFYEDAGSGALFDLREYGLTGEPIIAQSLAAGVDVVTFSGDKLFGAAQSGLIVGRGEIIQRLRKHPLYRALRAGKLIYAALEATLEIFRREVAAEEIPVLKMLSATDAEIKKRSENFVCKLRKNLNGNGALSFELIAGNSVVGGGSAPTVQPPTTLIAARHEKFSAAELEEKLRQSNPPTIARILEDKVLLDLRTVAESEEKDLLDVILKLRD